MKKYYNKNLDFNFYVDNWEEHTDEKLRVYDSNKDYCDYLEEFSILESCEHLEISPQEYVKNFVWQLKNAKTIKEFMSLFSYDYSIEEYNGQSRDEMTNIFGKWIIFIY